MALLKKLTLLTLPIFLSACGNDDLDPNEIHSPDTYEFSSQTDPAASSSVDYLEATTHLVLIKELQHLIGSPELQTVGTTQGKDAVIALLNKVYLDGTQYLSTTNIYNNQSEPTPISGVSSTLTKVQTDFSSLDSNINLKNKLPGVHADLIYRGNEDASLGNLIGWNILHLDDEDTLLDTLIQNWFEKIALLAVDGDPTTKYIKTGLDYQNLVGSLLVGAIPYYQATQTLLNTTNGLIAENSSQTSYTDLQHNWDLAFGYFGAHRQYKLQSKQLNATQFEFDSNDDNQLDLLSELNFTYASNAASLDFTSPINTVTFSIDINQAFLNGRQIINDNLNNTTTNNGDFHKALIEQANIITGSWERVIAAQLIHYLNLNATDVLYYGQIESYDNRYAKNWAFVKGYALALQFNPNSIVTEDELIDLHILIGQQPEVRTDPSRLRAYSNNLLIARNKLESIYSFTNSDVLAW